MNEEAAMRAHETESDDGTAAGTSVPNEISSDKSDESD